MPLPKFLGIGAPRCGTRWLAEALAEHPQISLPDTEVYFFTERRVVHSNWRRGVDWYSNLLGECLKPDSVTWGEITPFYLFDQETPQLMHRCIPNAKLICCLRDQSERAYSWYRLFLHFNPSLYSTDFSFKKFLTYNNEAYGREGFYLEHISRYLELYPRESMLILLFDDLKNDPVSYIQTVYRFLEVDPEFVPSVVNRTTNRMEFSVKRSRAVQRMARRLRGFHVLRNAPLARARAAFDRLNTRNIPRSAFPERHRLNPEMRERMAELYSEHNEELGTFLGRDLSHWNSGR